VLGAAEAIQAAADSVVDGLPTKEAAAEAALASAKAQLAVETIALRAATHLFDAGGASATKRSANLDRHWRNVRTLTTHNPSIYKARALGDQLVNGTALPANGFF
jgi:alkylation response protein AidB-like acyl-CoA dehydrogenase